MAVAARRFCASPVLRTRAMSSAVRTSTEASPSVTYRRDATRDWPTRAPPASKSKTSCPNTST